MWSIVSTKNEAEETKYDFLVGEEYIVGRKDCHILITGDQSISRKHALLRIQYPENHLNNVGAPSTLLLKETSKYGTSVNGAKLEPASETRLKDGDQISFGTFKTNAWRVKHAPLVVAASALPPEEKRALKKTVHKLGGHMVSDWGQQCTHLVMSQLNVTVKVISALVSCCPIVTPDFCKHMVEAVKEKSSLPEPDTYLPPIMEAAINQKEVSFGPNEMRKAIFKGKTFFFLTQKQFKRLHIAINMAGGHSELLDEDSDLQALVPRLASDDACLLYTEHQDSAQSMSQDGQRVTSAVLCILKRHKLRPIPESELGLAVLYVSTALHCNPRVAQAGLNLLSAVPSQSLPTQNILASDTQALSQQFHGDGASHSRKSQALGKEETASQPKRNVTSTPKISKISESLVEMSPSATPAGSSRQYGGSPEFSFQGKSGPKEETPKSIRAKIVFETPEGGMKRMTPKETIQDEGPRFKHVKVKQEVLSQDVSEIGKGVEAAEGLSVRQTMPPPPLPSTAVKSAMQIEEDQAAKSEKNDASKAEAEQPVKKKQATLDMFKKPKIGKEGGENDQNDGENDQMNEEIVRKEKEQSAGREVQVKEEPMDLAETEQQTFETEEGLGIRGEETKMERKMAREKVDIELKMAIDKKEMEKRAVRETKAAGEMRSGKRKHLMSEDGRDQIEVEGRGGQTGGSLRDEDDGNTSMWKKKARIDVFSQEEEGRGEDISPVVGDSRHGGNFPETALNIPRGFISARVPIEDQVNVKVEPDYTKEEELPSNLIQVKDTALIVRKERNPARSAIPSVGRGGAVKNFKKFKKAGFAGQSAMPRIIGGRDLFSHNNNPSKDIEEMFNEEVRAEKTRDKQEEMADKLFDFEPKRAPLATRKR